MQFSYGSRYGYGSDMLYATRMDGNLNAIRVPTVSHTNWNQLGMLERARASSIKKQVIGAFGRRSLQNSSTFLEFRSKKRRPILPILL